MAKMTTNCVVSSEDYTDNNDGNKDNGAPWKFTLTECYVYSLSRVGSGLK